MRRVISIGGTRHLWAAIAAVAVAFALGATVASVLRDEAGGAHDALTVSEVYARNADGVVRIEVTPSPGAQSVPAGPGRDVLEPLGSGFVYREDGLIVTNLHVVDDALAIHVRLPDGRVLPATYVAGDPDTDIAVIDVDAPAGALRRLHLADSSGVRVGDSVVAIGSPFGLQSTVTAGIVSAVERTFTSPGNSRLEGIQTDAAINHGSSGGPLLDMHGDVIGLVSQFLSSSGGSNGVGLAVPSSTVSRVVAGILAAAAEGSA